MVVEIRVYEYLQKPINLILARGLPTTLGAVSRLVFLENF
jgi:hypothetical protein